MKAIYDLGLEALGSDDEPNAVPVRVVDHEVSTWQSIAIFIGALASCATLYSVMRREVRR